MRKNHFFSIVIAILLSACDTFIQSTPEQTVPPTSTSIPVVTSTSTPQVESQIQYHNSSLGLSIFLPPNWQGFTTQEKTWEGLKNGDLGVEVVQQGLLISIVHPESSTQQPRQDIPIMVITIEQWNQLQQLEWHIGAAPINPFELGRNSKYVFALPARYNYAFLEGWEEVDQILRSKPIVTFEPSNSP